MKIKTTVAGLVIAMSMLAAGSSYAFGFGTTCPVHRGCAACTTIEGVSGIGWNYVPCNGTCYRPAYTWQQYVSGGYAPPVVRGGVFFGL